MKKLIAVPLVFLSISVFSQNTLLKDIELKLSTSREDTAKVDLLNLYISKMLNLNIEKADQLLMQNYELIQKLKYKRGEAYGLLNLARIQQHYLSDEAPGSVGKAIEIFEAIADKKGLIEAYILLSSIHDSKGNYPSSLDLNFKALLLADTESLIEYKALLNLRVSYIFSRLGDAEKSKVYLKNYFATEKSTFQNSYNEFFPVLVVCYTANCFIYAYVFFITLNY